MEENLKAVNASTDCKKVPASVEDTPVVVVHDDEEDDDLGLHIVGRRRLSQKASSFAPKSKDAGEGWKMAVAELEKQDSDEALYAQYLDLVGKVDEFEELCMFMQSLEKEMLRYTLRAPQR